MKVAVERTRRSSGLRVALTVLVAALVGCPDSGAKTASGSTMTSGTSTPASIRCALRRRIPICRCGATAASKWASDKAQAKDFFATYGGAVPYPNLWLPSGLTSTSTTTRADTLSGANLATFTEQTNLNGNTWTKLFNDGALTWTTTSPAGRTTTTTVDAAGRPTQIAIPNVAPFTFAYDAHGRLVTTTQGSHVWTQA